MGGNGTIEEGPSLRKVQGNIKPKTGGLAHGDKHVSVVVVTIEGDCFTADGFQAPVQRQKPL